MVVSSLLQPRASMRDCSSSLWPFATPIKQVSLHVSPPRQLPPRCGEFPPMLLVVPRSVVDLRVAISCAKIMFLPRWHGRGSFPMPGGGCPYRAETCLTNAERAHSISSRAALPRSSHCQGFPLHKPLKQSLSLVGPLFAHPGRWIWEVPGIR